MLAAQKFEGGAGEVAFVPYHEGWDEEWQAVVGVADRTQLSTWCLARAAQTLPGGTYRPVGLGEGCVPAFHGWMSAQYRFDRYRTAPAREEAPRVLLTHHVDALPLALAEAAAVAMVRDLVNTPAEDMGPAALEAEARALAKAHQATLHVHAGEALEREFPMVHAVGRAAARSHAPRLIELEWGDPAHPRLAVVGKGVCFDSGGLDIKPASGMALMKKDMGGAAHALALAGLIMGQGLPVRLHLLIPAVENAVSGNAFRPGDILRSRQGLSVEVTNTDAEGRLVLGDALSRASEENPALVIDFATLTGAARVALGPDLPAMFAREDATAQAVLDAGLACADPCWRLPLHDGYREWLKSDVADLQNSPSNGFAGSSVAALFLDRFVGAGIDWLHFDTFAWRPVALPGRPKGAKRWACGRHGGLFRRVLAQAERAKYAQTLNRGEGRLSARLCDFRETRSCPPNPILSLSCLRLLRPKANLPCLVLRSRSMRCTCRCGVIWPMCVWQAASSCRTMPCRWSTGSRRRLPCARRAAPMARFWPICRAARCLPCSTSRGPGPGASWARRTRMAVWSGMSRSMRSSRSGWRRRHEHAGLHRWRGRDDRA
jgi:leucyl aminopeptidase